MYYDLLRFILRCSDLLGGPFLAYMLLAQRRVPFALRSTVVYPAFLRLAWRVAYPASLRFVGRATPSRRYCWRKGEQSLPCDQLRLILLPRVDACGAKAISNYGPSILHCPNPLLLFRFIGRAAFSCGCCWRQDSVLSILPYFAASPSMARNTTTASATVSAEGSLCITTY